ncbi:hypothetical protein GUJ93_ZPchr0007g5397 [Zizania palustris]|uniref:Uncharacterized protein n=1 Tax=Zizania palustris TaxID=103762 RepID=A0A8J5W6D2_ZIZPA|nr:hypothetical protein GUJ93_ZPchr0007g5397 [Zizania palustris]KAG8080103.1 hypothetical protein GUJ93_ZPchr0007g5397 [Zizania palustris]KAG8080104.1 hypothetical protein GUJ93_ZPchr0007g5397 [Zizania palustris]
MRSIRSEPEKGPANKQTQRKTRSPAAGPRKRRRDGCRGASRRVAFAPVATTALHSPLAQGLRLRPRAATRARRCGLVDGGIWGEAPRHSSPLV